jgi:hypothetical protein
MPHLVAAGTGSNTYEGHGCAYAGKYHSAGSQGTSGSGSPLLSALTSPAWRLLRAGNAARDAGRWYCCNVRCCTMQDALRALQLSIMLYW